jgi:hypothetical protein
VAALYGLTFEGDRLTTVRRAWRDLVITDR